MHPVLEKIKSRGYWQVVIRPSEFIQDRIPVLGTCKTLVQDNKIILRGWDYPHYDFKIEPDCGLDHVEQFTDWQNHIECWRFYQSGQFIHYKALWEDWFEAQTLWGQPKHILPNEFLSIIGTVYLMTEIYEFASRLCARSVLGDSCEIRVNLCNTKNRKLASFDSSRFFHGDYKTMLSDIPHVHSFATTDLMSRSAEIALDHVAWLYQRFNWDNVRANAFKEDQRKFLEKRL